ncbi:hypothetical protein C0Q70_09574 [Pomacea canaliculata]|uniref:Uncharacterized protein n=1 Tax=Pomacea canaliculata TaxID=400727 RepID=A0A2T7PA61_POMCA|nr:hypothetical protein C0Q70_09574 [Pomacea canaliculata]
MVISLTNHVMRERYLQRARREAHNAGVREATLISVTHLHLSEGYTHRQHGICTGSWWWTVGAMLAGGALTVVAAPVAVAGLGFGAAGIGAGTVAAGAMSTAATTGVGMGVVSTLQAVGATGALTLAQSAVVGGLGAGVSKVVCDKVSSDKDKGQNDDKGEKADNGEPEDKDEDEDQGKRKDEDKDNN